MKFRLFIFVLLSALFAFNACTSRQAASAPTIAKEFTGGVNPYLWRASLDTLSFLPIDTADPYGGLINYDWQSFESVPGERIKATVFILDTRLRADGIKVSVFRQFQNASGVWQDGDVHPDTTVQIENQILARARTLKSSEVR